MAALPQMVFMFADNSMKKLLIILSIIATFALFIYAALVLYVGNMAKQDTKVKSDVIVVLGEGAFGGISCYGPICKQRQFVSRPEYSPCLVARIDHAVDLYKNHYASKILMSGGTDKEDNKNEAETMKTIAMEKGIPAADILMEKESTSTYENLALSQDILTQAHLNSAIIVTDPATDARAGLVASKLHYTYSLSPDINTPCLHRSDYVFREPLAIIEYFLLGRI